MITPEQLAKSGSEHGAQAALFCWANLNQLQYPELKYMFAIPNGGWRGVITGANLKAEGVKEGVPDILLPVKRAQWSGLFIEMKRAKSAGKAKGIVSSEQLDYMAFLQWQSYWCSVCVGWEAAKDAIIQYMRLI